MSIEEQDFTFLAKFLLDSSGLELAKDKHYLIESRLNPVAMEHGLEGIPELVKELKKSSQSDIAYSVIDAMTTNESLFFRDSTPFEILKDVMLPAIEKHKKDQKKINIWCVAGSTGQEPYSISMVLDDYFHHLRDWDIHILATDISVSALKRAEAGVFTKFEVQRGLSEEYLKKYFHPKGKDFEIKDFLKKRITFKRQNILDPFRTLGKFDIIFCRNILIYFNRETKARLMSEMADILEDHGYYILGAAESIISLSDRFKRIEGTTSSIYEKIK